MSTQSGDSSDNVIDVGPNIVGTEVTAPGPGLGVPTTELVNNTTDTRQSETSETNSDASQFRHSQEFIQADSKGSQGTVASPEPKIGAVVASEHMETRPPIPVQQNRTPPSKIPHSNPSSHNNFQRYGYQQQHPYVQSSGHSHQQLHSHQQQQLQQQLQHQQLQHQQLQHQQQQIPHYSMQRPYEHGKAPTVNQGGHIYASQQFSYAQPQLHSYQQVPQQNLVRRERSSSFEEGSPGSTKSDRRNIPIPPNLASPGGIVVPASYQAGRVVSPGGIAAGPSVAVAPQPGVFATATPNKGAGNEGPNEGVSTPRSAATPPAIATAPGVPVTPEGEPKISGHRKIPQQPPIPQPGQNIAATPVSQHQLQGQNPAPGSNQKVPVIGLPQMVPGNGPLLPAGAHVISPGHLPPGAILVDMEGKPIMYPPQPMQGQSMQMMMGGAGGGAGGNMPQGHYYAPHQHQVIYTLSGLPPGSYSPIVLAGAQQQQINAQFNSQYQQRSQPPPSSQQQLQAQQAPASTSSSQSLGQQQPPSATPSPQQLQQQPTQPLPGRSTSSGDTPGQVPMVIPVNAAAQINMQMQPSHAQQQPVRSRPGPLTGSNPSGAGVAGVVVGQGQFAAMPLSDQRYYQIPSQFQQPFSGQPQIGQGQPPTMVRYAPQPPQVPPQQSQQMQQQKSTPQAQQPQQQLPPGVVAAGGPQQSQQAGLPGQQHQQMIYSMPAMQARGPVPHLVPAQQLITQGYQSVGPNLTMAYSPQGLPVPYPTAGATAAHSIAAPVPEPRKKHVIRDKDGNILDLEKYKRPATSGSLSTPPTQSLAPSEPQSLPPMVESVPAAPGEVSAAPSDVSVPPSEESVAPDANITTMTDGNITTASEIENIIENSDVATVALADNVLATPVFDHPSDAQLTDLTAVASGAPPHIEIGNKAETLSQASSTEISSEATSEIQDSEATVEIDSIKTPFLPDKRNNKKAMRELLASAETTVGNSGGLLDAYTIEAIATTAKDVEPTCDEGAKTSGAASGVQESEDPIRNELKLREATLELIEGPPGLPPVPDVKSLNIDDLDDDWETTADKIDLVAALPSIAVSSAISAQVAASPSVATASGSSSPVVPTATQDLVSSSSATRKLTPGGGMGQQRLNAGPNFPRQRIQFSRDDVLRMKPEKLPERPIGFHSYSHIIHITDEGRNLGHVAKHVGYWYRIEAKPPPVERPVAIPVHPGLSYPPTQQIPSREANPQPQQMGGHTHNYHNQHMMPGQGNYSVGGGVVSGGQQNWKKMPQDNYRGRQHAKNAMITRPKKIVSDPLQQLSIYVLTILNKITPQTFEKLTLQLCDLCIPTNDKLERLISLVFEKAIQEPSFAHIYAEMCVSLDRASRTWPFVQVAFNEDLGQYFWLKDLDLGNDFAGPFDNEIDGIRAVFGEIPAPIVSPTEIQVRRIVVIRELLIALFQNRAASQIFVGCIPFAEINRDNMSANIFGQFADAEKDAQKNGNSFRRRLVSICQEEFMDSTSNEGIYAKALEEQRLFRAQAHALSADERASKEADLDEKLLKLKQRKLGNIRFVGELYKQGLISTKIMYMCLDHLIAEHDSDDQLIGWKAIPDEQDLELLCKFLQTVGSTLDSKSSQQLDPYFQRLSELTQIKSLNSRIRFSLQDVIELRQNQWTARREQEGPSKISEIHQKIAQESLAKQQAQAQAQAQYQAQAQAQYQAQAQAQAQALQGRPVMRMKSDPTYGGITPVRPGVSTPGSQRSTPDLKGPPRPPAVPSGSISRTVSVGPGSGAAQAIRTRSSSNDLNDGLSGPRGSSSVGNSPQLLVPRGAKPYPVNSGPVVSPGLDGVSPSMSRIPTTSGSPREKGFGRGSAGGRERIDRRLSPSTNSFETESPAPILQPKLVSGTMQSPPALIVPDDGIRAAIEAEAEIGAIGGIEVEYLSDEEVSGRVNSLIEEFIKNRDCKEFDDSMRELPLSSCGYLVVRIVTKFLDTPKADVKAVLMSCLLQATPFLQVSGAGLIVEDALKSCEPLLALNDACLDCQDAPDRLGRIIGKLVQLRVCRLEIMQEFANRRCEEGALDDYGPPLEELQSTYGQLIDAIKQYADIV